MGLPMLVLSRKVGERVLIGDQIAVTAVRVAGGGVRLGIEAPAELPVIREELKQQRECCSKRSHRAHSKHCVSYLERASWRAGTTPVDD